MAWLLGLGCMARAQAIPTATASAPTYNPGPSLPLIEGNFQYALSASEVAQLGLNGYPGVSSTTNLSGDVEYMSRSTVQPFSMLYSGGVLFSPQLYPSPQTFQNFTISQGFVTHSWEMGISDSFNYLPQSPTSGLAGIPGVGDQGLQPSPDPNTPSQGVLTNYARRISNTLSGNIERQFDARTSVSGVGSYGLLHYLDGTGTTGTVSNGTGLSNNTQFGGTLGLNRLLDRRSRVSLEAEYSAIEYPNQPGFNIRTLFVDYNRQLTKAVTIDVSAGPQWTSGYEAQYAKDDVPILAAVAPTLRVSANASVTYTKQFTTATVHFNRGVNSGSGLQQGALANTIGAQAQHTYGRDWSVSATAAYTQTTGLADTGVTTTFFGGGQVSRRISQSISSFISYSAQHQDLSQSLVGLNAFSGLSQSFAIGISFSPRANRLGQF